MKINGYNTDISPIDFELLVEEHLKSIDTNMQWDIEHNKLVDADDGSYQIDIYAKSTQLNIELICLIECKRHKNNVKREVVQVLNEKIKSIGAHKGIIYSTAGFQSGAIQYAQKHGIALITVINGYFTYHTKSTISEEQPKISAERLGLPSYAAFFNTSSGISLIMKNYNKVLKDYLLTNNGEN